MIYKCKWCGSEITHLETDGDEVCNDLICPECAERDWKDWEKEVQDRYENSEKVAYDGSRGQDILHR